MCFVLIWDATCAWLTAASKDTQNVPPLATETEGKQHYGQTTIQQLQSLPVLLSVHGYRAAKIETVVEENRSVWRHPAKGTHIRLDQSQASDSSQALKYQRVSLNLPPTSQDSLTFPKSGLSISSKRSRMPKRRIHILYFLALSP